MYSFTCNMRQLHLTNEGKLVLCRGSEETLSTDLEMPPYKSSIPQRITHHRSQQGVLQGHKTEVEPIALH